MTWTCRPASGLTLALALVLAAPVAPDAQNGPAIAKPESVGMSSERLSRISSFIKGYIDANRIAGAVTLVARRGQIVHFEAQGWRDKEASQPMQTDTLFSLASMTKPIVSAALMMLWEDGRFMLDDPISKWLPAYGDKQVLVDGRLVKPDRPITVRHVLTHTSGITLTPEGGSPSPAKTLAELIDRAAATPLRFHPGDRWLYGDSTDLVGILVEKISGVSLDQFLRERILQPLKMTDTHYNVPREKVSRVAAIYRPGKDGTIELLRKPEFREPTTLFRGGAGLSGTASDYVRFAQMLLNGGELDGVRLLGRMTVDAMFTNQIGTDKLVYVRGAGYGFGLGGAVLFDRAKAPDALSVGTWTWGGANGTIFWIDPVEELIPIMMIQVNPYSHLDIRPLFSVVASQAITERRAPMRGHGGSTDREEPR
ncbi:MAG: serine hydrolase domain-containing protein [Acidobacteriota bacterium]